MTRNCGVQYYTPLFHAVLVLTLKLHSTFLVNFDTDIALHISYELWLWYCTPIFLSSLTLILHSTFCINFYSGVAHFCINFDLDIALHTLWHNSKNELQFFLVVQKKYAISCQWIHWMYPTNKNMMQIYADLLDASRHVTLIFYKNVLSPDLR